MPHRRIAWLNDLGGSLCALCLGILLVPFLSAAPFDQQIAFTQPDGTPIQVRGWGDEFSAVFETLDGYTLVFDPQHKAYCFARQAANGRLVSTGVQAHQGNPVVLGLARHERMSAAARKQQVLARWQRWEAAMQIEPQWRQRKAVLRQLYEPAAGGVTPTDGPLPSPPSFTATGAKVGLTLLIDFSDDPATIPQAEIINYCNGDNYTGYGNNGSVKSYFYDNSGGLLTYANVVTIYIRAPQPKSYYNDTTKDCGDQANLLIKDALDTMKALPNYTSEILPTFADLTVDASSRVVACNVFYAGGNGGVWAYGLWPHSWSLYNVGVQPLGNGKSVYKYQITNIGSSLSIGTFCHENGHMLCGYPDIYDYDYDSYGGAGIFCLMGYGGSGGNPKQICAYLKRASGWATTLELNSSSSVFATVGISGTNLNKFYRYPKPGVSTEYYLIENRQKSGRDAGLPAAGVAVWHVDELGDRDNQSTNYNSTHDNYEVTLVQADNQFHFQRDVNSGDAYDLYYLGNAVAGYANELSDASAPGALWWDGGASGLLLRDFSASGTTMTFSVGLTAPPLNLAGTLLTDFNGNGTVDYNETNQLWIVLRNDGVQTASNVTATLTTATPEVVVLTASAGYPNIAPGQLATNPTPFVFCTTSNFVCGTTISFTNLAICTGRTTSNFFALSTGSSGPTIRVDNTTSLPVPDRATVYSTNIVAGVSGALARVAVSLYLTHTWDGDLILDLIAPDNTSVNLVNCRGGSGDNFGSACSPDASRTTFDDAATQSIVNGTAPFVGTFRPEGALSSFTGKSGAAVNGPWRLRIQDAAKTDTGTLSCWSLFLTPQSTCVDGSITRPVITGQPQSLMVTNGDPAGFSVGAEGLLLGYQWRKDGAEIGGATNADFALLAATTNDAGGYDVVVTNLAGSVTSTVATLTVYVPPGFLSDPTNLVLAAGSEAVFTATALGIPAPALQWYFETNELAGENLPALTLTNVQPTNAGSYFVVAANGVGAVTSAVAQLTVVVPPVITNEPVSVVVTNGDPTGFSVGAEGLLLSYQWRKDSVEIGGATNVDFNLVAATTNDAGGYDVVVTNLAGAVTSTVATLTVLVPPYIWSQPQSQFVSLGDPVALSVGAVGAEPLTYQWRHDTLPIPDATNTIYSIASVQSGDAGDYEVLVSNAAGSLASSPATLSVNLPPPALSYAATNGWLALWWPTNYTNFRLQARTNGLEIEPAGWAEVTGVTNNAVALPLDSGNGAIFFRLVSP